MTGIREMFADLDGYQRYEADLVIMSSFTLERQRERWRANRKRQRARPEVKQRDQKAYAERFAIDAEFRERRRAYWRDYDKARRARRKAVA